MSSLATPTLRNTLPPVSDREKIRLERSQRAKAAHTARPAGSEPGWERTPAAIQAATPAGYRPAPNEGQWLAAIKDHPALSGLYSTRHAKLMRLVRVMINAHQRRTSTLCITHDQLAERARVHPKFIQRALRLLKDAGLVAVIASGRSAAYTPKGRQKQNLAPVYLLLTPLPRAAEARVSGPVDESVPPSRFNLVNKSFKRDWKHLSTEQRCQRVFANRYKDPKTQWWPKHCPAPDASTTDARELDEITRRMTLTIQREAYSLRKMTLKSLAGMLGPYFAARWTVADILHALETRPDGSAWTTNASAGMRSIRAWVRTRLNVWTSADGPFQPASHHAEVRRQKLLAQQAADRAEAKEAAARKAATKDSPARRKVRQLAAISRCGSEQAARHQHPELF